ncbi:MAG: PHP domain-containing protein [Actinomycetia bacterium]|nr:PHP domain-containing protein [Actinomycetes bacterium]
MPADLHIHSTASDGTFAPAALVDLARQTGIGTIALADHDSVDGVSEALQAGISAGIAVIPAVELSAETAGRSVHVLGYFIDHGNPGLLEHLGLLRQIRLDRAREMVRVLTEAGYRVSLDDVLARSAGGSVGRAHVARALADAGHVPTTRAAFEHLIGRGKPFYVAKPVATPEAVIATINAAGGIAVLAHPCVSGAEDLIGALAANGLAGIEAFHAQHTADERVRLVRIAARYGLTVTGGSDFHGSGEGRALGDGGMSDGQFAAFLRFARLRGVRLS